jgi:hypothetical protein
MAGIMQDIEIGQTFMAARIEYKIIFINQKKKRINLELVEYKNENFPPIGQRIKIRDDIFIVTYINQGKNRISIEESR